MSNENETATQTTDRLLSKHERSVCQNIAQSGDELINKRASALLSLDMGSTRAEAGEQSGLTLGQVRYLLAAFRQKRLGIFPLETFMEIDEQPQSEEIISKEEVKEEEKIDKAFATKETRKGKKKQGKGKKKIKKDKKKGKKQGKGKKDKGKKGKSKSKKGRKGKKKSKKKSKK